MENKNYIIFKKLREYYTTNCQPLIFVGEKQLSTDNRCKMYFLDVTLEQEKNNYKKLFQEYLALYVKNYDRLRYYNELFNELTDSEISEKLMEYSYNIWSDASLVSVSTPEKLGIFGELFNDFYINIVKNENILVTYSSKRGIEERNARGVDILGATWEKENLTLIFSECKFVKNISVASSELVKDICGENGKKGHISAEYINNYMTFVVDQQHSLFSNDQNNDKILEVIDIINNRVINNEKAIAVFNEIGVQIRFTFFAIYYDKKFSPDERKNMFDKIIDSFSKDITSLEINKYELEVVFIPTKNLTSDVKKVMREWN